MKKDSNSRLSRTTEEISLRNIAPNTSENIEDGPASSGSKKQQMNVKLSNVSEKIQQKTKSYVLSSEDDDSLQCPSTKIYKSSSNFDREPIFVIVDSSCVSNPSSTEMLINKLNVVKEASMKKNPKNIVIPVDIPGTSKDELDFVPVQIHHCESREELQMVDINLQSDNEIPITDNEAENEQESIVIAYLRNKDLLFDNDEMLITTRKKSSLLENVPKMETILEGEQFSSFTDQTNNGSAHKPFNKEDIKDKFNKLSESSLDVHIPSYPGSPRSFDFGSDNISFESINIQDYGNTKDSRLKEAIEFLHEDKEFLIAADIGNDRLLEIYIKGIDVQQVDYLGRNALHLAVCSGNLRAIKLLLDAGVNPNIKDNVGMTPLSLTLMRRPSLKVANLLFDYGARIMPRSNPMDTGLFIQFAIMCTPTDEEENILNLLVHKGALINDPSAPGGRQALHFAAMSNNTTLIRILVTLGADLYVENHRGETPKETAATFRCKEAFDLFCQLEESEEITVSTGSNYTLFQ